MSKTTFPDVIGPSSVSANGATPVGIRKKRLNVVSAGVTASDDPSKRRTNLNLPDESWSVVTAAVGSAGEWYPTNTSFVGADMVRLNPSVGGAILTGLDSGDDPSRLVKFLSNVSAFSIVLQPPTSPVAGEQYFLSDPYILTAGSTVRATWDVVTRVYRLRGASPSSYIVLDGNRLSLDGNPILNPNT